MASVVLGPHGNPRASAANIQLALTPGQAFSPPAGSFIYQHDSFWSRFTSRVTNIADLHNRGWTVSLKNLQVPQTTALLPFDTRSKLPPYVHGTENYNPLCAQVVLDQVTAEANAEPSVTLKFVVTPTASVPSELSGQITEDNQAHFAAENRTAVPQGQFMEGVLAKIHEQGRMEFSVVLTNTTQPTPDPKPTPTGQGTVPMLTSRSLKAKVDVNGIVQDVNRPRLLFTVPGRSGGKLVMGQQYFDEEFKLKAGVQLVGWTPTGGAQIDVQIQDNDDPTRVGAAEKVDIVPDGVPSVDGGGSPQPDNFSGTQLVSKKDRRAGDKYDFTTTLSWHANSEVVKTDAATANVNGVQINYSPTGDGKQGTLSVVGVPAQWVINGTKQDGTSALEYGTQKQIQFEISIPVTRTIVQGNDGTPGKCEVAFYLQDQDGVAPSAPTDGIRPGDNTQALTDFRFLDQAALRIPVTKAATQPNPNTPGQAPSINPQTGQPYTSSDTSTSTPVNPNVPVPGPVPTPAVPGPNASNVNAGTTPGLQMGYVVQPPYMIKTTSPNNLNVVFEVQDIKYPGIWQQAAQNRPDPTAPIDTTKQQGRYFVTVSPNGMIGGNVPDAAVTVDSKTIQTDPSQQVAVSVKATYTYVQPGTQVPAGQLAPREVKTAGPFTFYLYFVDLVALQAAQAAPGTASLDQQNAAAGQAADAIQPMAGNDGTVYTSTQNPTDPTDYGENGNMLLRGPAPDQGMWWSLETKEASFNDIKLQVPRYHPSDAQDAPIQSHAAAWYMRQRQGQVVEPNTNWQTEEAAYKVHLDKIGEFQSTEKSPWTQLPSQPFHYWSPLPPTSQFAEAGWEKDKEQLRLENLAMRTFATQEAKAQNRAERLVRKRETRQEEKRMRDENKKRKLADMVDPRLGYYYNRGEQIPFASPVPNFNSSNTALPIVIPEAPKTAFLQNFMPVTTQWVQSMDEGTRAKRAQMLHDRFIRHPVLR